MSGAGPRILPSGERAVIAEMPDAGSARALAVALREVGSAHLQEVVPGARTVLVVAREPGLLPAVRELIAGMGGDPAAETEAGELVIEVDYDGEDLAEVAALTGLSPGEVVRRHSEGRYVVEFVGFAPGFGYLSGLDPTLHVPRLRSPRPSVPAGAVAIAGPYAAVYPRASPGGWRLLGRTDAVLFDATADPPSALVAGTVVRFVAR